MANVRLSNGSSTKLGRVDGALKVGNNAIIRTEDGKVIVDGEAEFSGNARVEGSLECVSLTVARSGKLRISGDLIVHDVIDVSNSIDVEGIVRSESIDVGGHMKARSVSCRRMRVGGTAEILGSFDSESVEVGGKIEALGSLKVGDLHVGGKARIGGGTIAGTINASGRFESTSPLEFGELRVYGVASLASVSRGKKVVISGKLDVQGELQCDRMELSGAASIAAGCKAIDVIVNGKLDVMGPLESSGELTINGTAAVESEFNGNNISIRGSFSAERAVLQNEVHVCGSIETRKGLRAKSVFVRRGSRCSGPIVADTVDVGMSGPGFSTYLWGQRIRIQAGTSQVEDVYAHQIMIGPNSRARRLFAESVELGSGCDIEDVNYTTELQVGDHVKIARSVQKVNKLQDPPTV